MPVYWIDSGLPGEMRSIDTGARFIHNCRLFGDGVAQRGGARREKSQMRQIVTGFIFIDFLMRSALAALIFLLLATPVVLPAKVLPGESEDELVQQGAVCDKKLDAQQALTFYLPAEKLDPRNPLILVPIARQYRHLMADA